MRYDEEKMKEAFLMQLPFDENRPRHKRIELTDAEKLSILRNAHWGVLSTVSADGEPYGVPVGFAYDEKDGSLIFHTARRGVKMDNLSRDSRVCFSVVGSAELMTDKFSASYQSVVLFGTMAELTGKREIYDAAVTYCSKFAPKIVAGMTSAEAEAEINDMAEMIDKASAYMAMYRLTPTHVSGKRRR